MKNNWILIAAALLAALLIGSIVHQSVTAKNTPAPAESETAVSAADDSSDAAPALAEGELDVSGTWYGYETYTVPNTNTTKSPDTVQFPWVWTFERTKPYTYNVHFYHEAVEGKGSIPDTPKYDIGVERMKLVDNHYMGVQNYVQVYFDEQGGMLMAHGFFNVIKSTGETDVRSVVLTRAEE